MASHKGALPKETAQLLLDMEVVFHKYKDVMTPSALKQIVYQIIHDDELEKKLYQHLLDEEYPLVMVFRDVLNTMTEGCASNIRTEMALVLEKTDLQEMAGNNAHHYSCKQQFEGMWGNGRDFNVLLG